MEEDAQTYVRGLRQYDGDAGLVHTYLILLTFILDSQTT